MNWIFAFFRRLRPSRLRLALKAYVGLSEPPPRRGGGSRRVAIQCVPNSLYFGLMCCLAADIKAGDIVEVDLVVVRSTSAAFGFSVASEFRRNALLNWLKMLPWIRSFGPFADRVAYRASSWSHPIFDLQALWWSFDAWQHWRQLKRTAQPDWASESIAGIICGDLVIDTFLRFRPTPRFDADDPLVWRLLWQTMRDIHRARAYFRRYRPELYLTSYSTYIEHGIPTRVALQVQVPVFTFGDLSHLGNRPTRERPTHAHDCGQYRTEFNKLLRPQQLVCLEASEKLLRFRLAGGVDSATRYMRSSAYTSSVSAPSGASGWKGAVVIFLHDFYDSPHVWPELVFTDFWEWICCTIETLDEAGVPYFIKPHPNQIALSDVAVADLKVKYPRARWLDPSTNNAELAAAPIACGITVYGTVAHELAYLGVPSIGAAAHPHLAFDFCRRARSREEYRALLRDYSARPLSDDEMREQALEFYSIHNNLHRPQTAALATAFSNYYATAALETGETQPQAAVAALDDLRRQAGYKALISTLPIRDAVVDASHAVAR